MIAVILESEKGRGPRIGLSVIFTIDDVLDLSSKPNLEFERGHDISQIVSIRNRLTVRYIQIVLAMKIVSLCRSALSRTCLAAREQVRSAAAEMYGVAEPYLSQRIGFYCLYELISMRSDLGPSTRRSHASRQ
jgi:hypothetical protein